MTDEVGDKREDASAAELSEAFDALDAIGDRVRDDLATKMQ